MVGQKGENDQGKGVGHLYKFKVMEFIKEFRNENKRRVLWLHRERKGSIRLKNFTLDIKGRDKRTTR